jgi:hypothetical protein
VWAPRSSPRLFFETFFGVLWVVHRIEAIAASLIRSEQRPEKLEVFLSVTVREKAAVTDPDESLRQDVSEEATEELDRTESHDALLRLVGVVLPKKGDVASLERYEAAVRDGHTMRVAGEVPEHMRWATEGRLGIDKPVLLVEGGEVLSEQGSIAEVCEVALEAEVSSVESTKKVAEELASEQT